MKIRSINYSAFIFLFLISLISCDNMFEEKIEGNNVLVSREREISDFDEIESTGKFDVYVTIADSISLRIEVEENLLPFIITRVSGQKFYIEEKDGYRIENSQAMKIYVTTPNMEGAKLTGSGLIKCDTLNTDFLSLEITGSGKIEFNKIIVKDIDAEISGSGDMVISGNAERSDFEVTGSGSIRTLDLIQRNCYAEITGSGNIYVNVENYLNAIITGSGNIYYIGNPNIDEDITGTGDVKRYK